jgi:hypothetical protein
MLIAVECTAFGALTPARCPTAFDAAQPARASLPRLPSVDDVLAEVGDLLLAQAARAHLLVLFEQESVPGTETAAAILTRSGRGRVATPEHRSHLARIGRCSRWHRV